MFPLFFEISILVLSCMILLWIISLLIKDASIVDIFWGIGFVIINTYLAYKSGFSHLSDKHIIFFIIVNIWGLRLAGYLAIRNLGKGEDFRYKNWRAQYADRWWWLSFFRVFILQGIVMVILGALFIPIYLDNNPLSILHLIGLLIWLIGFIFEAGGDLQLMVFKSKSVNKGKVLNSGFWKYTRHPNYFGDAMIWWGYFLFAVTYPYGIFFILCPIIMTYLLIKISGVAMLEKSLVNNKSKYHEYIRKTPAFFPWLPKK